MNADAFQVVMAATWDRGRPARWQHGALAGGRAGRGPSTGATFCAKPEQPEEEAT